MTFIGDFKPVLSYSKSHTFLTLILRRKTWLYSLYPRQPMTNKSNGLNKNDERESPQEAEPARKML